MIGSVHVYADSPFHAAPRRRAGSPAGRSPRSSRRTSTRCSAAIRSGLFDTIGHLDFVKRYLVPVRDAGRAGGGARSCTSRCSPRSSRPGPRSRSTRAASARRRRDLSRPRRSSRATGCSEAPRSSAGSDAHRNGSFTCGPRGGVWCRGRRGVRAACLPSWRIQGRRGPAGSVPARRGDADAGAHLTGQGSPSL